MKVVSRPRKVVRFCMSGAVVLVALWFYAGFYFTDLYAASLVTTSYAYTRAVKWGGRLVLPVALGAIATTWHLWRKGRVSRESLTLFIGSLAICLLLIGIVGSVLHDRYYNLSNRETRLRAFHPFLQKEPDHKIDPAACSDASRFWIVCLGGSTTAWLRKRDGKGWPDLLEERLRREYPGREISVINSGTQWYSTLHMLITYETIIRPCKPDMIVVMEAINDLLHNADFSYLSKGVFREDYGHFLGPLSTMLRRSTFSRALWESFCAVWYGKRERQVVETDIFPGLETYERNLDTIIDLARADGTEVVLMTQPCLLKEQMTPEEYQAMTMVNYEAIGPDRRWSHATARRGMEQYNDCVRRLAARRNVMLVDLDKEIPKSLQYFKDEVHYRDTAFEVLADALAASIVGRGLIREDTRDTRAQPGTSAGSTAEGEVSEDHRVVVQGWNRGLP